MSCMSSSSASETGSMYAIGGGGTVKGLPGMGVPGAASPVYEEDDAPPGVSGAAPGVLGAIVLGVAGLNFPFMDVRMPPERSAIKRTKSPMFSALWATMPWSDGDILDRRYCMGAERKLRGV